MTPYQTGEWCRGAIDGLKSAAKVDLGTAYHGAWMAAAAGVGKLPPLADVLGDDPKKMTGEQIGAALERLAKRGKGE